MDESHKAKRYFLGFGRRRPEILPGEAIGQGGEAMVFDINLIDGMDRSRSAKYVAKIYDTASAASRPPRETAGKLRLLIDIWKNNQKRLRGICFPRHIITDERNRCVGFLMARYHGHSLAEIFECMEDRRPDSMLWWSPFIKNIYNKWTRVELAALAINIIRKLETLHTLGLLMSDINPSNILVLENGDVLLIDVDSYQVGRYTCPVYRPEFAAPRLAGKGGDVFITLEDEDYAVAVLVFQILFCGHHPYARRGNEPFDEQIQRREFAYPLTYGTNKGIPVGPFQNIWYSLPPGIQTAFHRVFHNAASGGYPDTAEWISLLEEYKRELVANSLKRDIFPTSEATVRQEETFLGYDGETTDTDPSSFPGLRTFETIIGSEGALQEKTLFAEFGSDCIRCYDEHDGRWIFEAFETNHFDYIRSDGVMDTPRLAKDSELGKLAAYLQGFSPASLHVRAFGGSFLRMLPNREETVRTLREATGLNFGILTREEEATMLADMAIAMEPSLEQESLLIIDVGGLATDLILRSPAGEVRQASLPRLGRHTLRNWFFSTYPGDNRPAAVFSAHDAAVRELVRSATLPDFQPTAITGFGTVRCLIPHDGLKAVLNKDDISQKANGLTRLLASNRTDISSLHGDTTRRNNRTAYINTVTRLTLPIYASIMQHFGFRRLTALRSGLGKAYIHHFNNSHTNEQLS